MRKDRGLKTTTTSVISGWMESINRMVPAIVTTPVNSWVKPMRSPSENCSMSVMTRLIRSPAGCASI